ncbi:hypothetical protein [Streptomyces sp. ME19-01-6]|uniref:hypothetical protein n=1 Tax=Streptomyces sp. ME19-01-6 TaxID=3028686 RepID=UPI0029A96D90|nr:hypothetical protein [Streptomyces sp. ME19-01-6]MDX3233954.1 hypothetical protein [Streptomyces sp. ME19-01-6]
MVLSIVTALARNLVMVPTVVLRSRVAKDADPGLRLIGDNERQRHRLEGGGPACGS